MNHSEIFSELGNCIRELAYSDEFLEQYRVPHHFVRKGQLSMRDMVLFILYYSRDSLDNKLGKLRESFPEYGFPSVTKQALSKARFGINYELFKELFDLTSEFYYENVSERRLWNNKYHLFAIDGSVHEVPSSESAFEEFGKQSDQKNPKLFWSMALVSILYDVLEDVIVDASVEKQFFSERELSLRHLSRMTDLGINKDSLVIFDRGYYSALLFEEWTNAGCKVLMRLKQSNSLCEYAGDDTSVTIELTDGTKVTARVIKYRLSSGEIEYLITNVMDEDITPEMFGELYFYRWNIEKKYLELKEQWKIEEFTGTSAVSIRQDFYTTLLHANLASLIKHEADDKIEQTSRSTNSYKYQARRSYIIGRVCFRFAKWLLTSAVIDVAELVLDASKKHSQIQPKRSSERKRRTRVKKHYPNKKSSF